MKYSPYILLASLAISFPAFSSQTLQLNGIDSNYIQPVSITFNNNTESVYTGAITGSLGGFNPIFFCYDLSHNINVPGTYSVNPTSPSASFPNYLGLSSAFNLQVVSSLLNNANVGSFTSVNQYSGLQLAIWSILYNWTPSSHSTTTLGTATDPFSSSVTGAVLSDALGFLSTANTFVTDNTYSTSFGGVQVLVNANDSEGNVTQTLAGIQVPEPQTYLILGTLSVLVLAVARKKKAIKL